MNKMKRFPDKQYWPITILLAFSLLLGSCKKFVEIPAPLNSVTTSAVFADSASASAGLLGIYSKIMGTIITPSFGSGMVTLQAGQSADELGLAVTIDQSFAQNALAQNNGTVSYMWTNAYSFIYQANLCIEGLQQSTTIPAINQTQFIAEAKFVRAFFYFYLVNLFGDVPYVTQSDWTKTFGSGRTPVATIYNNLIEDLKYAQQQLPAAYPSVGKIRPIQLAATALLARVYLYKGDWANAQAAANTVITSGVYPKLPALSAAFLKNSDEAIWQLLPISPNYNTLEGYQLISPVTPVYYMLPGLISSFEPGDRRYTTWVDSVTYQGAKYYYPYKYKVRTTINSTITEYYTMLRLAEQYLIRAEASAHLSDIPNAIADLNSIRERAGLPDLLPTLTSDECYAAIEQERRIELFSEWGHRWLDLKRTGRADAVLAPIKPKWLSTAILWPIPLSELQTDPSLTQNPGY